MQPNNNLSLLPFYDKLPRQYHNKSYVFGKKLTFANPDRKFPSFQIVRYHGVANSIVEVLLIQIETNTITNITVDIQSGVGQLKIKPVTGTTNYDLITYYPNVEIPNLTTPEGHYYLKISDGVNIWWSEIFAIINYTDHLLRLSWWHHENLESSGVIMKYSSAFVFKNHVFIKTELGRPKFLDEEKIKKIDGREQKLYQVSWKQYQFQFYAPEHLLDVLRLVFMHSFVELEFQAQIYRVDEIQFTENWDKYGDFAQVTCEFTTDTIALTKGGALTLNEYNDQYGECLVRTYQAVAQIKVFSPEYSGFYYAPISGGKLDFKFGDYVVIEFATGFLLFKYQVSPQMYVSVGVLNDQTVYVINKDIYYFVVGNNEVIRPVIDLVVSGVNTTVTGRAFVDASVEVFGYEENGTEHLMAVSTNAILTGAGITFPTNPDISTYVLKCSSGSCVHFATSVEFTFFGMGIGWMEIKDTNIIG